MKEKKQRFNGEVEVYHVDISPERMKKVKERFKDIDKVRLPLTGVQLLEKIRKEDRIIPLKY
ncbi:hypothetical protein HYV89_02970 [Candidatus Woesearchaeota archaeon]|nr:hypothetical protein [Candidatus Woesearchaeota archaeon]